MAAKVWFITGTSKGFGRVWAEAALARGDRVAATARDVATLQPLVDRYGDQVAAIALDVNDKAAVERAVAVTIARFGRIDVAVNNAGFAVIGAVEEASEADVRAQFDTNVFGALWVTQAVLPQMRAQKSGHILQISSIAGINAFPTLGIYNSSKWALEGFSQALAAEVAAFGIKVTLIEPSGFATDWRGGSARLSRPLPQYEPMREGMAQMRANNAPADPLATGPAILKLVDVADPPLRVFFGAGALPMTKAEYARRLETWEQWNDLSIEAQGGEAPKPT